jgi:(p)ppGpp synthase/HD superfamily hydrolase
MSTSYEQQLLFLAELFAIEKHRGQKRLDGQDYITHPILVSNSLIDTQSKIVGMLHDTLEDTNTTLLELTNIFGKHIAECVHLLTKSEYESYSNYINRIVKSDNELVKNVKIADLINNLSTIDNIPDKDKRERLKSRYENALMVLQESNCI